MGMRLHRLNLALLTLLMIIGVASSSYADISNAAVLFLRIAPGSRSAGMGEAFVAVADDATTTHWNPAGLGTYPLAHTWIDAGIPKEHGPLLGIAALKSRSGSNYLAYDVWGISGKGLVRFDHKKWHTEEVFHTKTDETVSQKVREYFTLAEGPRLDQIVARVAVANNAGTYDELVHLRDLVMAQVPEDYEYSASLQSGFDSLLVSYDRCLVRWEQVRKIQASVKEGLKDSLFSSEELERVNFAIEKSVGRFIPEDLVISYSDFVTGELTSIVSDGEALLAGTTDGLLHYNGIKWQRFDMESGLPSNNITCLYNLGVATIIGTDQGIALHNGLTLSAIDTLTNQPTGFVEALGGTGPEDAYAIINNDLYHYDGVHWSNTIEYTVVLDDTPESIAEKFAIYGSSAERDVYLAKFAATDQTPQLALQGVGENEGALTGGVEYADVNLTSTDDESLLEIEESTATDTPIQVPYLPGSEGLNDPTSALSPGRVIQVPYLAELRGEVSSIHIDESNQVWLGTDHGVLILNNSGWSLPGFQKHIVEEGETLESLVSLSPFEPFQEAEEYAELIRQVNDLQSEQLTIGEELLVYANPASSPVSRIEGNDGVVYVATSKGLFEQSSGEWSRTEVKGLGEQTMTDIAAVDEEIWFLSVGRIVTHGSGRTELSLMHVKWLPELADDLYYEFASFVKGSDSWGTFGGNVTFISYGTIIRRGEQNQDLGSFESFEIAFTGSYGTALTNKLAGGVSAKVIYSKLSDIGAGQEKGKGTATGFAIDVGLLYQMSSRMTLGMAITNVGPKMAYIDAAQADDLPRNLAVGFAYKLLQSEYNRLLLTAEVNKMLVGLNDGLSEELRQLVLNGGAEFVYANLFAIRAGYIYDQEGRIKTVTLGAGVALLNRFKFDFAYIPSSENVSLANTLRISISILP